MQTEFAFGKTGLTVSLPEGRSYDLIQTRSAAPVPDADAGTFVLFRAATLRRALVGR